MNILNRDINYEIIGAAIEVHKVLGPGLLESVYEKCLEIEFIERGLKFQRQVLIPLNYKGKVIDSVLKLDFLVENSIVLELKSVDKILPVHEAQILTYMKLVKANMGLLINFNVPYLKEGIGRYVL